MEIREELKNKLWEIYDNLSVNEKLSFLEDRYMVLFEDMVLDWNKEELENCIEELESYKTIK